MRHSRLAGLCAAVLLATPAVSSAQAIWVDRGLTTSPPRSPLLLTWVPTTQTIWWFGSGATGAEIWDYDGDTWRQLPVTGPVPSVSGPAAYDADRHRLVWVNNTHVWEFDGTSWTQIVPVATPTPTRSGYSLVYDGARKEVLQAGGEYWDPTIQRTVSATDLWGWDGTTWTQRSTVGAGGRRSPAMAYDSDRQVVVKQGGYYTVPYYFTGQQTTYVVGDTAEWDGTAWTAAPRGAKRTSHSMAYDSFRKRTVVFGGFATCGYACGYQPTSTDEFDGTAWSFNLPAVSPPPRNGSGMAFDERRKRIVMTGGHGSGPIYATWEYYNPNPAQFSTFGSGCPGTGGTPSLELESGQLPWVGGTFGLRARNLPATGLAFVTLGFSSTRWGPTSLPLSLGGLGAPLCSLLARPDHVYPLLNLGGTGIWQLSIPNNPAFAGFTFYDQVVAVDPPANPAGLVFSDASMATIEQR